ncbi:hypothetical protein ACFTWF_16940 [Rhodococcus sp. NPDC056960]|uniref:hypothetical protein n=1 Tax=Rhodococcus sp. NPDC056960 TaxID=3345982 RepID=UPI0036433114
MTDIRNIYLAASSSSLEGITVYRCGSKEEQVLTLGTHETRTSKADTGFTGGCAGRACEF